MIFNLTDTAADTIDVSIFGFIDPGWMEPGDTSSAEIKAQLDARPNATKIRQTINSVGGSAFGGVAIYNLLTAHGAAVESIVVGQAASAASISAMAGRTVMMRGSVMMLHNPWTAVAGNADELRAAANVLDTVRDALVSIYQQKTGKSVEELQAILSAETWLTAEEAVSLGFADEIRDGKVTAQARAEGIAVNAVLFPRERCAPQILAMATSAPPLPPIVEAPPLTRDRLAAEAPALLAALLAEGAAAVDVKAAKEEARAAGAAAERARLQAIDDLGAHVAAAHPEIVAAAKYGETQQTAADVAIAVLKATRDASGSALAARRAESAALAGVKPAAPINNSRHAAEEEAARGIAQFANRSRGARS